MAKRSLLSEPPSYYILSETLLFTVFHEPAN